jgi:hypothetical protein
MLTPRVAALGGLLVLGLAVSRPSAALGCTPALTQVVGGGTPVTLTRASSVNSSTRQRIRNAVPLTICRIDVRAFSPYPASGSFHLEIWGEVGGAAAGQLGVDSSSIGAATLPAVDAGAVQSVVWSANHPRPTGTFWIVVQDTDPLSRTLRLAASPSPTAHADTAFDAWSGSIDRNSDLVFTIYAESSCAADVDCFDGNPCTTDACSGGSCRSTAVADGSPCADGSVCNGAETCRGGVCTAGATLDCDDGDACTADTCAAATGCRHTPLAGCPACGTAGDCDDGNPCTDDLCDPLAGCVHADNGLPCSDGNPCTTGDVCRDGGCVGGAAGGACMACDAAAAIPPGGGTFTGATSGAGTLAGLCGNTAAAPERVYRWTPSSSGTATIQTCGSGTSYDTVVYLRSGTCTGTQVACNDDACGIAGSTSLGSRITPAVTAGETYYVVVDGYGGRSGAYTLTVTPPSACGNNVREGTEECDGPDRSGCASGRCAASCTCTAPAAGLPDMTPEIADVTFEPGTSVDSGDVAEGCAEAASGVDLLRFTTRVRNAGTADLSLGDPRCPAPCTAHPLEICGNSDYTCSPAEGHNHGHYTNYARYDLVDVSGQTVVVGHKQGFCLLDSDCPVRRYSCSNQGISAGCADVYHASLGCQYLDVTGVPPGDYVLRVTIDPFGRIAELDETNNVASVLVLIPAGSGGAGPGGSGCTSPTVVPAGGGVVTGTTAGTGTLAGTCGASAASPEQVFQWTPARSGTATIQTCGSGTNYDSVVYLRSGSCNGAQLACNDDACLNATGSLRASRVTATVGAGQTYFIVVDGFNGARGTFRLSITAP